jgi:two-component system, NtrC family, sensor histidine kinase HydH
MEELRARTTLFCGVIAFAIALSMLLRGRRMQHWLFAAFSTCVAFWYVSQSLTDLMKDVGFERVTAVLTVLLPQFAVHLFGSISPLEARETEVTSTRSRLPKIATALALPMLAVALSPYQQAGPWVRALVLGAVYFYVFGLLAAALIALWLRGQKSPSRAVRDRIRFLASVGALAMTFTLGDFVSFLGVYLPPIGAVLAVVFLFVLAESLTRPRLADLYELSGRLLVSTALAFALAGIFYVFITYVGRFGAMYLNAVLAAIVFLVLFEPLEHEVETRINRFFFRERYDLETSVVELRRRLAHTLENEEMIQVVLAGLERSRRVTSCAIYLRDLDDSGFDVVGSVGTQPSPRLEALAMRPLLERLGMSLSLEEIAREADNERDTAAAGAREALAPTMTAVEALGPFSSSVILAIRGDAEELVGMMCVADDRVRDAFTPEEIALLETVAAQMGVAIANSRIYARMKERDRLAALGSMAAGLAHEVKNPLGAIKGAAQLLEELGVGTTDGDPQIKEFLGIILEETDRLNRVVGSFLDYARPHAGNPVPVDVNGAVRRTVQILSSQHAEGVDVKLELSESLPRARIDPEKLRQVLLNLVHNAIHAMDGRGHVTVGTTHRRTTRGAWASPPSDRSGALRSDDGVMEVVEISVHDTGPGISQKVLKNLFVPFFTTKEKGTGLGLAISQSIVQNAGGSISVQTQAGMGTKFVISLPAADETIATPVPAQFDAARPALE